MKKIYKALMLDLDGTTIPNKTDGMPSSKVIEAVLLANKKIHIGAVTGRPLRYAQPIIHALSLTGPSIVNGGAMIVDSQSSDILWEKLIAEKTAQKILEITNNNHLTALVENKIGKAIAYDNSQPMDKLRNIALSDLSPAQAEYIHALLKHFADIAIHKLVGWKQGTYWLQITHAEATKQHGIMEVAKLLGIQTHEIIGVGDGYNDFPLLMACGLKVAIGNAVDEIKAIADYIAPSVEDDGVVDIIHKFIL